MAEEDNVLGNSEVVQRSWEAEELRQEIEDLIEEGKTAIEMIQDGDQDELCVPVASL